MRWEEEVQVRQIPYTVQRIEYEDVVEDVPVKVCRYVTETRDVSVPRTVGKWVQQTSMRLQPRIETYRVQLGVAYDSPVYSAPPGTTYYRSSQPVPAAGTPVPAGAIPVPADSKPSVLKKPLTNGTTPPANPTKAAAPATDPAKTQAPDDPDKNPGASARKPEEGRINVATPAAKPEEKPAEKKEGGTNGSLEFNKPENSAKAASTDRLAAVR
jgi:hypothetical protein